MKRHTALAVIFSILFFISLIISVVLAIIKTTVLDEDFTRSALDESGIIAQSVDRQLDESISDNVTNYIDTDNLKASLKSTLSEDIENVVIDAIYNPNEADNTAQNMQSDITNILNSEIKTVNPTVASIAKTVLSGLSQSIYKSIGENIHYLQLKKIGYILDDNKGAIDCLLIVSATLTVLSLIVLFSIGRRRVLVVLTVIAALLTAMAGIIVYFTRIFNLENLEGFLTVACKSIGIRFMTAAGIEILAAFVIGIISLIVSKRANKKYTA